MKKLLLAISTVVAFTGSAFAADLARKAPPMAPPPPPPPSFTGCWLSGGVGYGLFDQESTIFDVPSGIQETGTTDFGGRGWLGRIGAGCDYQFSFFGNSQWVIGAFGDYDWTNIRGRRDLEGEFVGDQNLNNQWAIGGRIGWVALPNLMTFVSGGYTQAHFGGTAFVDNFFPHIGLASPFTTDAVTHTGWFIGGGEEYAFNWLPVQGLFWKTEYRLSEFDRQDVFIRAFGVPEALDHQKTFVQTITTSLVWRFNFGGLGGYGGARY
jgi:outer membrane immunogenic protein